MTDSQSGFSIPFINTGIENGLECLIQFNHETAVE